jgi:hypothetical protein
MRLRVEHLEDRTTPSASLTGVPSWFDLGPNPIAGVSGALPTTTGTSLDRSGVGAIESVVVAHVPVSTNNPGGYIVYAATVNGGVSRADNLTDSMIRVTRNDQGQLVPGANLDLLRWRPESDQEPSLAISALTLDSSDSSGQTVYAGTGTLSSFLGLGGLALGLLKTTDGGHTWINLGRSDLAGSPILGIAIAHAADGTENPLVASMGKGVLYSQDGGQSFHVGSIVDQTGHVTGTLTGNASDIVADPNTAHRFYAAVAGQGIFRSDNDGVAWTVMEDSNSLQDFAIVVAAFGSDWIRLAVHNDNGSTDLYAAISGSQQVDGVWRTVIGSDGSANWLPSPGTAPSPSVPTSYWHFSLTADPTNAQVVYLSGYQGNIWRGDFSNNTWTLLEGNAAFGYAANDSSAVGVSPHSDSRHLTFLNNNMLLETDDGGIYGLNNPQGMGSTDRWVSLNASMEDTEFFSLTYDARRGTVFGGTQDNGTPVQSQAGWSLPPVGGGDGGYSAVGPDGTRYYFDDQVLFRDGTRVQYADKAGDPGGSGLTATDKKTWYFASGFGNDSSFPIATNPDITDQSAILLGMNDLYESFDGGNTVNNLTASLEPWSGSVACVTYGGPDEPIGLYVASSSGQLWVRSSLFNGLTEVNTPSWGGNPSRLAVDPDSFQNLYVLLSDGEVWEATSAADNSRIHWTNLTDNLPRTFPGTSSVQTSAMTILDRTPGSQPGDNIVLVGTKEGVWGNLGPAGCSWQRVGQALPNAWVTDLHYDSTNDILVAGTYGRGAWIARNVRAILADPSTLTINADDFGTGNSVDVRLDPNNSDFLQVLVNNHVQYDAPSTYLRYITINATADGDTIHIEDIPTCITVTTMSGYQGTVTVGKNGTLQGIVGDLKVTDPSSYVQLIVDDSTDTTGRSATIDPAFFNYDSISGLAPQPIYYLPSAVSSVTVYGGSGGNTFQLRHTAASTPVTIHAGSGTNSVTVGSSTNSIDPIQGLVTIDGQGGTVLTVNDQATSSQEEYDVYATQVLRTPFTFGQPRVSPTQTINYVNLSALTVNGGSGQDIFGAAGTPAGTTTALYGGTGHNEFFVENNADTLDDIQGPVALHGGSIYDFATANDGLNTLGHTYTLTADRVQRNSMADITYDGLGEFILATGDNPYSAPSPDTVSVQSTAANTFTILVVGTGGRVTLGQPVGDGSTHSLQSFLGSFRVQSLATEAATVSIDDAGNPSTAARTATFDNNPTPGYGYFLSGLSPLPIYLSVGGGSSVSVRGDAGNETFVLRNAPPGVSLSIDGAGGNNTLQGPDGANVWSVTTANAGSLNGNVQFTSIQNLVGGASTDTFQFRTGGSLAGSIDGGSGTNTLDYTAYTGDILVDLLLHTASLVGQGVFNVANVNGSQGNDLIVGDANANVLVGGTGRNVLIGDGGSDTINGGGGFNLLIGGTTSYDNQLAALQALMQFWDNASATSLDQLVNPLRSKNGVTVNGQLLMLNKTTVQNDNAPDSLVGGGGANWFIEDKDDTINNGNGPGQNYRLTVI